MLFYVQMKWNYQGRISQERLWQLEAEEGQHGLEGIRSGLVKGLYKVASQHRVIAIVDVDSLENLDRNSMGWLPMREYLEFEQVWALRDYAGFIDDARAGFPPPAARSAVTRPTVGATPSSTQEVAAAWFGRLGSSDFDGAMSLLAQDVRWDNIPPTKGVSDVAPWLGSYVGRDAVLDSFKVWAAHSEMIAMELKQLVVDGEEAWAIVHEQARCRANGNVYDLMVATCLTARGGKIVHWRVFWDPSPLIAAYPKV